MKMRFNEFSVLTGRTLKEREVRMQASMGIHSGNLTLTVPPKLGEKYTPL
jgi:hypothetical protein